MGKENLVQYKKSLTPEERRERASIAGIASGESRRKRKQMRNVLAEFMGADVTEPKLAEMLEEAGLPATQEAAICFAAVKKAQSGDIEACRFVRDTLGEKPIANLAVSSVVDRNISTMDLRTLSNEELQAMISAAEEDGAETTGYLSGQ